MKIKCTGGWLQIDGQEPIEHINMTCGHPSSIDLRNYSGTVDLVEAFGPIRVDVGEQAFVTTFISANGAYLSLPKPGPTSIGDMTRSRLRFSQMASKVFRRASPSLFRPQPVEPRDNHK